MNNTELTGNMLSGGKFDLIRFEDNNRGKVIEILPMVHIGPEEFYEHQGKIIQDRARRGYAIHHEGVRKTHKTVIGKKPSAYKTIADALGFSLQPFQYDGVDLEFNDLVLSDLGWKDRMFYKSFIGAIKKIFWILGRMVGYSDEAKKSVREIYAKSMAMDIPDSENALTKKIGPKVLDERNALAINKAIDADEDNVILVWGAGHVNGMEKILYKEGFTRIG